MTAPVLTVSSGSDEFVVGVLGHPSRSSTPTRFYRVVRPPIPTVSLTEIVALCWDTDDGECAA